MQKTNAFMSFVISLVFFISLSANAQKIPTSSRAETAIGKVKPTLEKEMKAANLKLGSPVFIRIFKESNELEVWVQKGKTFSLFKTYEIYTWGGGTLGPKTQQGDGQAPEGFYFVKPINLNPLSDFHLSFNLGYPNAYDRYHKRTGSALMVHGSTVSIGCYAMTDTKIEEIYTIVHEAFKGGQSFFRVHAFPFRMTEANMEKHAKSKWIDFWLNLKEGYDKFETSKTPPNVEVKGGKYVFNQKLT